MNTEKKKHEISVHLVDKSFFDIFTFPLLTGDPGTILEDPNSAIITESLARVFFGEEDPLGKTITLEQKHTFVIRGIMKDAPLNFPEKCLPCVVNPALFGTNKVYVVLPPVDIFHLLHGRVIYNPCDFSLQHIIQSQLHRFIILSFSSS